MTSSAEAVEASAARIEAVIFDVDGVLTRGEIIHGPDGGEWKMFHVQDGCGFALARHAGLKTAMLTGRSSQAVRTRAAELKVDLLQEGVVDKGPALQGMLERLGVKAETACYVGDDLVDIAPMKMAGLGVAVANAVPEVREAADWVTAARGGEGAAREVIERILKARGLWEPILDRYVKVER